MSNTAQYEYEECAFLEEDQFLFIKASLDAIAVSKEIDNKSSYFFVLSDINLSIASSVGRTVIKYKGGQLGLGNGFEELEVPIPQTSLQDSIQLFSTLLGIKPQFSEQFRINYDLGNNIEMALKYTQTWGFHLEIEKLYQHTANLDEEKQKAKHELDEIAKKLDISFINDKDMYTSKIAWAEGVKFGKYSAETFNKKYGKLFSI
jgi:hypothetical protein